MIITHSLPPHVNDFYEKLMMLKCPLREREERKWKEMDRETEREGGGRGWEVGSVHKGRGWCCVSCKYRITAC